MVGYGPAASPVSVQTRPAPTAAGPTNVQALTLAELAERVRWQACDSHTGWITTCSCWSPLGTAARRWTSSGTGAVQARWSGHAPARSSGTGRSRASTRHWSAGRRASCPRCAPPPHWSRTRSARSRCQLAGEDEDAVINEVTQLGVDCERHSGSGLGEELLRHQLAVLILRVAMLLPRRETRRRRARSTGPRRQRRSCGSGARWSARSRTPGGSRSTPPGWAARSVR